MKGLSAVSTKTTCEYDFVVHGMPGRLSTCGFHAHEYSTRLLQQISCATSLHPRIHIMLQALTNRDEIPQDTMRARRQAISRQSKTMGAVDRLKLPMSLFHDEKRLVVDLHEHGLLLIDGPANIAQGYLVQPNCMDPSLQSTFFYMSVCELLRWNGLYVIHGAALERFGKGILITGPPCRGKTTASLSLLRGGYGFISDDFPLLRHNRQHIELLAFQDWVDVRSPSVGFFPELHTVDLEPRYEWTGKNSFAIQDLYPESIMNSCKADLIIFPRVVPGQKSSIEPMTKFHVLKEILPQGLQVHSPTLAKREFELYTKLVKQCRCCRLNFGDDLWELPTLIDLLLKE